jgi:hypothetical protein
MRYRTYQLQRIKDKLCFSCGAPRDGETTRCAVCKAKAKKTRVTKYQEARLKGACVDCKLPCGKIRCDSCLAKARLAQTKRAGKRSSEQKIRRLERIQAGVCVHCGKVPAFDGLTGCLDCAIKKREDSRRCRDKRNDTAKATNACTKCGKECIGITQFCLEHYIADNVASAKLSNDLVPALVEKWISQKAKCALTGIDLIPGKNVSLEHLLCQKYYDNLRNEITNLVWADRPTNAFKRDKHLLHIIAFSETIVARKEELLRLLSSVVGNTDPMPRGPAEITEANNTGFCSRHP